MAIKNTLQNVANIAALKEGWDLTKKFLQKEGVQQEMASQLKEALQTKGLTDEGAFERTMSFVTSRWRKEEKIFEKILVFREAMGRLEADDALNGTKRAQHARIIFIAADLENDGQLKQAIYNKDKQVSGSTATTDISFTPHSAQAVKNMLDSCDTVDEFLSYLGTIGAFQKAPYGTIDEVRTWMLRELMPGIQKSLNELKSVIDNKMGYETERLRAYTEIKELGWKTTWESSWILRGNSFWAGLLDNVIWIFWQKPCLLYKYMA